MLVRTVLFAVVLAGVVAYGGYARASAEPTTAAHVYQSISMVNAQLSAFHDANGTMPASDPEAPPYTERSPRHVWQKAREVLLKVQALRQLNGLPLQPVPEIPVREVNTVDVKFFIDKMLIGLNDLRPVFGNPPQPPWPPLVLGKTPTENVAALRRAELQLNGLGIPPTAPNDVMRIALSTVSDLELVRRALGVTTPVARPALKPGMPADVYDNVFALLVEIKHLTEENPALAIPKGVILPHKRTGVIRPPHVMDLLGTVLAEISAIKAKIGITTPTQLAPPQTGMTPSDVYATISYARGLVATLRDG